MRIALIFLLIFPAFGKADCLVYRDATRLHLVTSEPKEYAYQWDGHICRSIATEGVGSRLSISDDPFRFCLVYTFDPSDRPGFYYMKVIQRADGSVVWSADHVVGTIGFTVQFETLNAAFGNPVFRQFLDIALRRVGLRVWNVEELRYAIFGKGPDYPESAMGAVRELLGRAGSHEYRVRAAASRDLLAIESIYPGIVTRAAKGMILTVQQRVVVSRTWVDLDVSDELLAELRESL